MGVGAGLRPEGGRALEVSKRSRLVMEEIMRRIVVVMLTVILLVALAVPASAGKTRLRRGSIL